MNNIYKFSPIKSEDQLNRALEYITSELEKLSIKLFDQKLPITTLKVFPHYLDEYDYLYKLISEIGKPASFNSKTSYYVKAKKLISGYQINYLGIRIVDPYRMQVGCGDYEVDIFDEFKKQNVTSSEYIRSIRDDMIEVWHPDFDILGYVIPAEK